MLVVFTLTSGRSGTRFLADLIRVNARDCVVRHEPYFELSNPSMFGRPIYDYATGDLCPIRSLVEKKRRGILRHAPQAYLETSHAFLKSYFELAPEYFSEFKLLRLIRNPLRVALSETRREELLHCVHFPLRYYRGRNHERYFRWALTGLEPIFNTVTTAQRSRFEHYVLQWIEIENRAQRFLDQFHKHDDCFTLHTPEELNQPKRIGEMLEFLGLRTRYRNIRFRGHRNRNPGGTRAPDEGALGQFQRLIEMLPDDYLAIFRREPFTRFPWIEELGLTRP